MKIIDLAIANGFRRMKAAVRTDAEMSRILGLSKAHVGRILKGKTIYLSDDTWSRIESHLGRYIISDEYNASNSGTVHGVMLNSGTIINNECLSAVMDKILASDELTDEEKVKVLRVLKKG